jgi:hypothetical protein
MAARSSLTGTLNGASEIACATITVPGAGTISFVNGGRLFATEPSTLAADAFTSADLLNPTFQASIRGPTGGAGPTGYTWGDVEAGIAVTWGAGSSGSITTSPSPQLQQSAFPEERINLLLDFSALASTSGSQTDSVRIVFDNGAPPSPMVFVTLLPYTAYAFAGYEWEAANALLLVFRLINAAVAGQSYRAVFSLELTTNTAPHN